MAPNESAPASPKNIRAGQILKYKNDPVLYFRGFIEDLNKELSEADFAIVPPGYPTGFLPNLIAFVQDDPQGYLA